MTTIRFRSQKIGKQCTVYKTHNIFSQGGLGDMHTFVVFKTNENYLRELNAVVC